MFRRLKENKHGFIFVTVLMIILVMMVLTISVMSLNVGQVKSTEGEVRRLQAEVLTSGALAQQYASQNIDNPAPPQSSVSTKLGNITYTTVTRRVGNSFNITTNFSPY